MEGQGLLLRRRGMDISEDFLEESAGEVIYEEITSRIASLEKKVDLLLEAHQEIVSVQQAAATRNVHVRTLRRRMEAAGIAERTEDGNVRPEGSRERPYVDPHALLIAGI
ncbi:hypothetical protein [Salisaeta icosahedral phage 1]|uniref:hypothetical protein n=1 Tax=Salisaeta icosahedral phage 1 TaxID=1183239 RepID=UPI00025EA925|nr:hypothetical protein A322_gp24 [Salisaeta icosahedral phage 1]AFJ21479.1 hypothetical protein [Salisaeta icosahedral phage 1]